MNKQDHAKRLTEFIDDKISDYKKETSNSWEISLTKLTEIEKGEFAYLIYENNRSILDDFSSDSVDEVASRLLSVLRNNDAQSKIDLADALFNKSIESLKDTMQALLTNRCNELYDEHMRDCGFQSSQCEQTGEHQYRRRYA